MNLSNPYVYEISREGNDSYSVVGSDKVTNFIAPVTNRGPKIYVFSENKDLLYIGQTIQGMSARIRLGFKADGTGGYWGYKWRNTISKATLHIWCVEDLTEEDELRSLECIESEVIFLYRTTFKQWPKYQTEIHFHESNEEHRKHAMTIFREYW